MTIEGEHTMTNEFKAYVWRVLTIHELATVANYLDALWFARSGRTVAEWLGY